MLIEMTELPPVGSIWDYTHETRTYGNPIKIEVVKVSNDNCIITEVQNEDFLQEQVESIRKTYQKNGKDIDNAEEVVPFASYNSKTGEFEASPLEIFFSLEAFQKATTKSA